MSPKILTFTTLAVAVVGCAHNDYQASKDQVAAYLQRHNVETESKSVVTVSDRPYVKADAIEYRPPVTGGITMKVVGASLFSTLGSIAEKEGFDVSYTAKVNPSQPVTISMRGQQFPTAVKDIAYFAGYIAVIDAKSRRITVTDEATFTFKFDPATIEDREDGYSTNSNPGESTGGGGKGDSNSGGSSSAASSSTDKVGAPNTGGNKEFLATIRSMIGAGEKSAAVNYVSSGILTVRGNSAELRRVTEFIDTFQRDASMQVYLEAAIIDVALTDDMQYGIDWSRMVPLSDIASGSAAISLASRGIVTDPTFKANITTNSVTSVIRALKERTNVNVVSEPKVRALNHRTGIFTQTTQIPYVPKITQSTAQNVGTTTSGELAFVSDGVRLSFKPNILGPNVVRARIMPVITSVGQKDQFALGQSQLTGFRTSVSQSHLEVELEANKTTIVGGLSVDKANNSDFGVPVVADIPLLGDLMTSKSRNGRKTQTVMLLHARIIPGLVKTTLIGESL